MTKVFFTYLWKHHALMTSPVFFHRRPGMGYLPRPMGQHAHFIIFIFVLIKHVICVLVLDYCTCFIANDLGDIVILKLWDWSAFTLVRLWLPLGLFSIPKGDGLSLTNLSGFGWARDGGVSPRSSQSGVLRAGLGLCIMYTGLKTCWKLLIKLFSKNMVQAQLQSITSYQST